METPGLRRTVYRVRGTAISLAFVPCLADEHPAVDEKGVDTIETLGGPPEPRERGQYVTTARVRRALGRDRAYSAALRDRAGFEATLSRIMREGF